MTWDIALILGIDGLANGAIYLLAGLGLVLIFSVTRSSSCRSATSRPSLP